jgi:dolichol-phosphate mannosyltransferase
MTTIISNTETTNANSPVMNSQIHRIAVVLPAYNEEKDLPFLLDNLQAALQPLPYDYKIVVVDDGSKDRTAEIAAEYARRMPVRLVRHAQNQGLGRAIQTGLREASHIADVVITMDADNSHDPKYIREMVGILEKRAVDLVIASRFQKGSVVKGVPLYRQMLSWGCFAAMRLAAPYANVRDYSTGFRAYRATALQRLINRYGDRLVEVSGFACMLEVLLKLRSIGTPAIEIPYTLRYDQKLGASKLRIIRTLKQYYSVISKFWGPQPKWTGPVGTPATAATPTTAPASQRA